MFGINKPKAKETTLTEAWKSYKQKSDDLDASVIDEETKEALRLTAYERFIEIATDLMKK